MKFISNGTQFLYKLTDGSLTYIRHVYFKLYCVIRCVGYLGKTFLGSLFNKHKNVDIRFSVHNAFLEYIHVVNRIKYNNVYRDIYRRSIYRFTPPIKRLSRYNSDIVENKHTWYNLIYLVICFIVCLLVAAGGSWFQYMLFSTHRRAFYNSKSVIKYRLYLNF